MGYTSVMLISYRGGKTKFGDDVGNSVDNNVNNSVDNLDLGVA